MTNRALSASAYSAVIALLAGLLPACSSSTTGLGARGEIEQALTEAAAARTPIRFTDVIADEWDHLAFICPYAEPTEVTALLGFAWNAPTSTQASGEGLSTFVFTAGSKRVIAWAVIRRSLGDPCGASIPTPRRVPRQKAVFALEPAPGKQEGFYQLRLKT